MRIDAAEARLAREAKGEIASGVGLDVVEDNARREMKPVRQLLSHQGERGGVFAVRRDYVCA